MTLEEGADRIVGQCLAVHKGEHVLVVADIDKIAVGEALFHAVRRAEAEPVLTLITPGEKALQEPPDPVAWLMPDCEVIIIATGMSMTHTRARMRATKAGARVASLPGVTAEMLGSGGITADYKEVARFLMILGRKLRNSKTVHLTSGGGSDVTFSVQGRQWITEDNGLATRKGEVTTLPAGEVFVAPVEGTAEGRLVFDVRLQNMVEQPATLMLRDGYATRVVGAKSAVAEMNRGGKEGRNFGKLGIGLNPRANARGAVIEAQKALGAVHVVFGGSAPYGGTISCDVRVDGIMTGASVEVDGRTIVERGKLLV